MKLAKTIKETDKRLWTYEKFPNQEQQTIRKEKHNRELRRDKKSHVTVAYCRLQEPLGDKPKNRSNVIISDIFT